MNEEPFYPTNDSELIFGINQNQCGFIDPKFTKPLDEKGNPIERKHPPEKIIISHYWIKKKKQISAIGAFSCLVIVAILVQETAIFDTIFTTATNLIFSTFNLFLGLFL